MQFSYFLVLGTEKEIKMSKKSQNTKEMKEAKERVMTLFKSINENYDEWLHEQHLKVIDERLPEVFEVVEKLKKNLSSKGA